VEDPEVAVALALDSGVEVVRSGTKLIAGEQVRRRSRSRATRHNLAEATGEANL